jgi:hypothetical protein
VIGLTGRSAEATPDPFGREPERSRIPFPALGLSVARVVVPVATTWALAGPVGVSFHLLWALFTATVGALAWVRARLGLDEEGPAAHSPLRRPRLKRTAMTVAGAIYAAGVFGILVVAGETGVTALVSTATAAVLVATEEARVRLGLPAPEERQEPKAPLFAESTSTEFHATDHAPWERFGPPRAG